MEDYKIKVEKLKIVSGGMKRSQSHIIPGQKEVDFQFETGKGRFWKWQNFCRGPRNVKSKVRIKGE